MSANFYFGMPFVLWNLGFFRTSLWIFALYGTYRLWRHYGNRTQTRSTCVST